MFALGASITTAASATARIANASRVRSVHLAAIGSLVTAILVFASSVALFAAPPDEVKKPSSAAAALLKASPPSTSVFGIEARGSRIVYVFDRSGSMGENGGRPLAAARRELLASLEKVTQVQQFQIIFYDHEQRILGGTPGAAPKLYFGDEASKKEAARFVEGITPGGGTRHYEALSKALNLAPDVVFFLTDGDDPGIAGEEYERIHRRASTLAASIHTIQFGPGPDPKKTNFLTRLAGEHRGKYVYVDVNDLPAVGEK